MAELQGLVGMIRVTVVEILWMGVEAGAEGTVDGAMTGAEVLEDVVPQGPLLRPEAKGRQVHRACPVHLVEANNEL